MPAAYITIILQINIARVYCKGFDINKEDAHGWLFLDAYRTFGVKTMTVPSGSEAPIWDIFCRIGWTQETALADKLKATESRREAAIPRMADPSYAEV